MNIKKFLITIVALIIFVSFGACNLISQNEPQSSPTMAPETETNESTAAEETIAPTATPDPLSGLKYWLIDPDKRIYNILLLGLDELEGTTWARNDTTMILQINLDTNEIKLVSFMRDMMVDIPGNGEYRINNAHYRGGPELAIKTMKSVFGVDIDYYAIVDFVDFEQVMKIIGPIVVEIKDYEVESLKQYKGVVPLEGEQVGGTIKGEGENTLNYYQALSYARDRHSSGDGNERAGDYGRNLRQREVIKSAWRAVKYKPQLLIVPSVFFAMVYVDTNMDESLIITLLKEMMDGNAEIEDMAIPVDGRFWSEWVNKERTQKYTNDELESLYAQEKAQYDAEGEVTATGDGTVTPEPAQTERPPFPSYERWRSDKDFSNVIGWSKSNISVLQEFLGIN